MNEFDSFRAPLEGVTLVEAGAGTGKTYNIQNLFLRLLLRPSAPLPIGKILVVTFTEAATAELRERIRRILASALAMLENHPLPDPAEYERLTELLQNTAPETAAELLRAALRNFDEAAISTIHGFCWRMLQENAFESGVRYGLELQKDPGAIRQTLALDAYRREMIPASRFKAAIWQVLGFTGESLEKKLRPALENPELLLHYGVPIKPQEEALQALEETWERLRGAAMEDVLPLQTATLAKFDFETRRNAAQSACAENTPELLATFLPLLDFPSHLRAKTPADFAGRIQATPFFVALEALRDALDVYRAAVLNGVLVRIRADFEARKNRDNFMTFDDLLRRLDERLCSETGEVLARSIRNQYGAALVDEFQDTDPVQFRIFRRIFAGSPNHGFFMIGDPKQAIYAFRGGDIHAYLHARTLAERSATLTRNFRSSPALAAEFNTLWGTHPSPFALEGIAFPPVRATERPGLLRNHQTDTHPLRFLVPARASADEALQLAALEVRRIFSGAEDIRIPQPDGSFRPIRFDDLAILVRSNRAGPPMLEFLNQLNIPAVWGKDGNVFDAPEATEIETLLRAVLDNSDPGAAAMLLAGEFHNVCGAEILRRRESGEFAGFQRQLARLAGYWEKESFLAMLHAYMHTFKIREHLISLPQGERKLTNLLHLGEILHGAALERRLAPAGLHRFLLRQLNPATRDEEDAYELRLATERSAVRILTIHSSKGLEFPLVLLPDLYKPRWKGASSGAAISHAPDGRRELDLSAQAELHERGESEWLQESLRLAYVAITRAVYSCTVLFPANTKEGPLRHLLPEIPARLQTPLPPEDWTPLPVTSPTPGTGAARVFSADIAANWRVCSFSTLSANAPAEYAAADRDAATDRPEPVLEEPSGIFLFPAGARSGDCWHKIFEDIDFDASYEAIRACAAEQLRFHSLLGQSAETAETRIGQTCDMLRHVLQSPLPGVDFRLRDIGRADRLSELEFHYAFRRSFDSASLAAFLRQKGYPLPGKWEHAIDGGFMTGFIDLIFRCNGKYYIADWKSNSIGRSFTNFHRAGLAREMERHAYCLQYLIYTVALVKFLRQRLGTFGAAEYERSFGGVFYFFVRGIDRTVPERGIWFDRPDYATIAELEEMIG